MAEAFDIFGDVDNLLEVLVLSVVEDWVVDDDAVDVLVAVGGDDGVFDLVAGYGAERIAVSTVRGKSVSLHGPISD